MVNLLNLHPNILVSHEADVAWLLYQLHREPGGKITAYPLDEEKGLQATLQTHGDIFDALRGKESIDDEMLKDAFSEFYVRLNNHGRGQWDEAAGKQSLVWVGDKKPVQQADPSIWSFLDGLFPQARYLHVIRDPRYVVASMREAADKWNRSSVPSHWRGTDESIFQNWIENEERVLHIKRQAADRVHTVRLEDLAARSAAEMEEVMNFLDLRLSPQMEEVISEIVWKNPNGRHEPPVLSNGSKQVRTILETYGYNEHWSSS